MIARNCCGKDIDPTMYGYESADDPIFACNAHLLPPGQAKPANFAVYADVHSLYCAAGECCC
jgi:hypothetical protein